jgi:hypothetical protein
MIAAVNGWVVAFDNISYLQPWLSDAICRLATGGSLGKRKFYTNSEESLLTAHRPILLTGIDDMGTRSDLLDRCVSIELVRIKEDRVRERGEFMAAFEEARPRLLGALLDRVAQGLRLLPEVRAQQKAWPRMASFAQFGLAATRGLDPRCPDLFSLAYTRSRDRGHEVALESNPAIRALIETFKGRKFEGTAEELLAQLALGRDIHKKGWPGAGHVLSGILNRVGHDLRAVHGWRVEKLSARVWLIDGR